MRSRLRPPQIDLGDIRGDLCYPFCGLFDIVGDPAGDSALLLHGGCDLLGDRRYLGNDRVVYGSLLGAKSQRRCRRWFACTPLEQALAFSGGANFGEEVIDFTT